MKLLQDELLDFSIVRNDNDVALLPYAIQQVQ